MARLSRHEKLQVLIFPFIWVGLAAASPDPRLLSLIPPDAQLVAGVTAAMMASQPDIFVLTTPNNSLDLQDFFSLAGVDDKRTIDQIIFVAAADKPGQPGEHSLLISGRFDHPRVFRSAVQSGATVTTYGGIPVLQIQPFAREQKTFRGVRWLAILDSTVLVFGTVATTQIELDRYLLKKHADEDLLGRLARLHGKNQTWCLLSSAAQTVASLARGHEVYDLLVKLSPELAEFVRSGNDLKLGVHYGRRVEIEYEVTFASAGTGRVVANSFRLPTVEMAKSKSLLPTLNTTVEANAIHGRIAFSISRYNEWVAQIKSAGFPAG